MYKFDYSIYLETFSHKNLTLVVSLKIDFILIYSW